jgi:pimeloyl-ACP methyl ester carboxylesterase
MREAMNPMVLLTGLGNDNDMRPWPPGFLNALTRFAGVLIYDRRGFGQSADLRPEPVTAKAAATDLRQLLGGRSWPREVATVSTTINLTW